MDFVSFFYYTQRLNIISIPLHHLLLEISVAVFFIWVIFKKSDARSKIYLSKEELQKVIDDWTPEPLVQDVLTCERSLNPKIIEGKVGKYIQINGSSYLNLATHNYLGFIDCKEIEYNAIKSVKKYGVGSCGPRGFYGTVDVHLELEERLANFMNMEEAVVYSYGFSTIASAIPAYAKRRDIIFVDEYVNFAIQKGLDASRSEIKYFRHGDMEHLETLLQQQAQINCENRKKAEKTRMFLIVEGIYMNFGDICPLPKLIELRKKYKLRIFIDESTSFGTLGKTGRGVTEYFNILIHEVDLIMVSLEGAIGSIGGFCVGSSFIVEHQRLSGLGYCFSASLPPLLTSAAISALEILERNPNLVLELQALSVFLHTTLEKSQIMEKLDCFSDYDSPVKHLYLKSSSLTHTEQSKTLEKIVQYMFENGIVITTAAYLQGMDKNYHAPSIRLTVNVNLSKEEIIDVVRTLEKSVTEVLSNCN